MRLEEDGCVDSLMRKVECGDTTIRSLSPALAGIQMRAALRRSACKMWLWALWMVIGVNQVAAELTSTHTDCKSQRCFISSWRQRSSSLPERKSLLDWKRHRLSEIFCVKVCCRRFEMQLQFLSGKVIPGSRSTKETCPKCFYFRGTRNVFQAEREPSPGRQIYPVALSL